MRYVAGARGLRGVRGVRGLKRWKRLVRSLFGVVMLGALVIGGCASSRRAGPIERSSPPAGYAEVASRYNQRIERLDRIWAVAVVELDYLDDRGRPAHEQGEGHLQIRRPGGMALSIGKLGEVYAWLGADEERFWFFDKFEEPRVVVERFENVDEPCADTFGLPADPHAMIDLMGVGPIPPDAAGTTAWSLDGRWIVVSFPRGRAIERLRLTEGTLAPVRVEITSPDESSNIVATLGGYKPVVQSDEGGFFPKMASRIEINHADSGTRITLHLSELGDGRSRPGRLSDAAFDFDTLRRIYQPALIEVLDRDCPTPALAP